MMYMIRRTTPDGKMLFRKSGLTDYGFSWNRNGKCWTSLAAFKSCLQQQFKGYRGNQAHYINLSTPYPEDRIDVLEIDIEKGLIRTVEYEQWCSENLGG